MLLQIFLFAILNSVFQVPETDSIEGKWNMVEYVGNQKNLKIYPKDLKIDDSNSVVFSINKKDSFYFICGTTKSGNIFDGYIEINENRFNSIKIVVLPNLRVYAEHVFFFDNIISAKSYNVKGDYLYVYFENKDKQLVFKRNKSDKYDDYLTKCKSNYMKGISLIQKD